MKSSDFRIKEAATGGVLSKKVFLKTSQYSQETPALESLFNKVAGHTFPTEHFRMTTSGINVLAKI